MNKKTIVIFSVSVGSGHVRAADAIKAAASERYPDLEVIHIDLMTLVPPLFKTLYADTYLPLVQHHPALWGYLYQQADKRKLDSKLDKLRIAIERLNTQKFKDTLQNINPDAVICTHFLPAELLSRWRRKKSFLRPTWVVVTDFDAHMLWVHRDVSGYFVADDEVAWRLQDRGVPKESIRVSGIPIMPDFCRIFSRQKCAEKLGLDPRKPTLLLMSGGGGIGNMPDLARRLLALDSDFQMIALAGRNQQLLRDLQEITATHPRRCFPLGFTDRIGIAMGASDLAVTKSGGLTSAECLATGLPMIVVSPIPGQEERNADFLLEHGAALKAYDMAGVEFRVNELLNDRARMKRMRRNAVKLSKPKAAYAILDHVLSEL